MNSTTNITVWLPNPVNAATFSDPTPSQHNIVFNNTQKTELVRDKSFFDVYGVTGSQVVVGAVALAAVAAGITALSKTEFAQNLASSLRFKFWVNLQSFQAHLQGANKSPEEIVNLSSIKHLANEVLKLEEQKKALLEQEANLQAQKDAILVKSASEDSNLLFMETDMVLAEVRKELQTVENRLVYIRA